MIGKGTSAMRKANMYSRPLNFTAVFMKFYVLMACLFTACNFGACRHASGLEGNQRMGGTLSLLDFSSLTKESFAWPENM
jgi:hypothetical protein